jgi:hypothetical protein
MMEESAEVYMLKHYRQLIQRSYPDKEPVWPLLSGYNCKIGTYRDWLVIIYTHTGNSFLMVSCIGELPSELMREWPVNDQNKELIRARLEEHFMLQARDGVVFIRPEGLENSELTALMRRHEHALGLSPMRIFLSHKGFNKPLVREFATTLSMLGFEPWLDEDAMPAGTNLERGILKGFVDSCAAVFFVTPEFKDEDFLATQGCSMLCTEIH